MNYVAAMLLLVLGQDEEDAFWVLASLIDDNDEGGQAQPALPPPCWPNMLASQVSLRLPVSTLVAAAACRYCQATLVPSVGC